MIQKKVFYNTGKFYKCTKSYKNNKINPKIKYKHHIKILTWDNNKIKYIFNTKNQIILFIWNDNTLIRVKIITGR